MSVPLRGRPGVAPWPYTFVLAGVGVMGGTATRQTWEYRSYKPPDQANVAPTAYGYAADNPVFGAVTVYQTFPLGMGLKTQRKPNAAEDLQYDHALGVDMSAYPWVKGPEVTLFTPATTDATNGVVRFLKVGTDLYAVTGRYALRRVSDSSWTVAQDFGAGKVSLDALAFYSNGVGAAYGFVAMGDADNLWSVTGGVWAQHASLRARAFGLVGREFFRAHTTNTLAKVDTDADPLVAANWSSENAFTIGDKSSPIVRLPTTAAGVLLAVKSDGVYTLDAAGDDVRLHAVLPEANNGRAVGRWGNDLYVGYTHAGFWRYDATGAGRTQVGPELLTDGSNVVTGVVTACCGVEGAASALWGAFWHPDAGTGYLCKFVGLLERDGAAHPVWHGSLTQPLPAKVTALETATDGAPAGHARLYLGFADGSLGWLTLPCTRHPADCSSYRFALQDGTLRLPTWGGGFGGNTKALDAVTCVGRNLSPATYVRVATRSDPAAAFVPMDDVFDTAQREKVSFRAGESAVNLDLEATLVNATTPVSPLVLGLGLHHQVQTDYRQAYEILVLAEDGLRRRDGTPMRTGARRVAELCATVADTPGSVEVTFPEGDVRRIRVPGVRRTVAYDVPTRRARQAFALTCVEISTVVVYGNYDRIEALGSYFTMEQYSYAQLEVV